MTTPRCLRRRPYGTLELRLGPEGSQSLCVKMVTVIAPFKVFILSYRPHLDNPLL